MVLVIGEATDGDLDGKWLVKLVKLGVALGPADGILEVGAGGLGGDQDARGATLVVAGVGSDITADVHGMILGGVKRRYLDDLT